MSDDDLTDHIPLKAGEDMMITQYDAGAVEANGLLKMDFLGLRNLTFVQKMKEQVQANYGISIDIKAIDLEDRDTLALFAAGQTKGIFQFEQAGAINLLKRIKPNRFEDIVATTSLNRPGASDYTDNFVNRRFGRESVDLIDPAIASILEPTYGIMLYQEQVMQIAQVYAGFSLGKADLLRRAMSKKNAGQMQKMSSDFLAGALALGHSESVARDIFDRMAKFAGYGFNRSHAFAYSALAFQLAYFKVHYPDVFFDVMLNHSSSSYIVDALDMGFQVATPSINTVPYHDRIGNKQIYLGLRNIKGLPKDMAYWISQNQPFKSIEDFLTRLPSNYQKAEFLTPLIRIGLFDEFDKNRHKIEENLENLFTFVAELGSLFADSSYSWTDADDYTLTEKYRFEQEIIGIGVSPHPLTAIAEQAQRPFTPIADLQENQEVTVLVQIDSVRIIRTKSSGQQMAFLSTTDTKRKLDVTIFPETYVQIKSQITEGQCCFITGRIQNRNGRLQMILNGIEVATTEKFWILLENHANDKEVSRVLSQYPGNIPVILHYQSPKETIQSQKHFVQKSLDLEEELKKLVLKTIFR